MKGQISFFDNLESDFNKFDYPDLEEYDLSEKLAKEKEVAGVYLTGHPLDQYKEHLKKYTYNTSMLRETIDSEEGSDEVSYAVPDDTTVTMGGMLVEAAKRRLKRRAENSVSASWRICTERWSLCLEDISLDSIKIFS